METADKVILRVLTGVGEDVPSTKLVKLVYLVDYTHYQHYGRTLTGFEYVWDHYGPNALDHAIIDKANELVERGLAERVGKPNMYGGETITFKMSPSTEVAELPGEAEMIVQDILSQYGMLSVKNITRLAKRTAPFRDASQYSLLQMEQLSPAGHTSAEDWEAHCRDLEEHGTMSLEEIVQRYGLD
jgi:hypothetical protein